MKDPTLEWPMCLLWIFCFPVALAISIHYEMQKTKRKVDKKMEKYHYFPWWY